MFKKYTDLLVEKYANCIDALVLVGSLSRGEEAVCRNNGNPELLSDIEFLAIAKKDVFGRINRNLDNSGSSLIVGFTTKEHLRKLKPYIFTIETKRFGKVLWGDRNILNYIPDYSYKDINPIDGFILLNNRIVEQLILWQMILRREPVRYYDIAKGYIQLVNSFLAVNRAYKSLYPEKLGEFMKLSSGHQITRSQELDKKVREAFEFLKHPTNIMLTEDDAANQWKKLRGHFQKMWLEEAKLFAEAPFFDRLKGWIKVIMDSKKRNLFSLKEVAGNLFKISPQFLIYRSAVREYFSDNPNPVEVSKVINQWRVIVK